MSLPLAKLAIILQTPPPTMYITQQARINTRPHNALTKAGAVHPILNMMQKLRAAAHIKKMLSVEKITIATMSSLLSALVLIILDFFNEVRPCCLILRETTPQGLPFQNLT